MSDDRDKKPGLFSRLFGRETAAQARTLKDADAATRAGFGDSVSARAKDQGKGGDDTKDVSGNGSYTHMTLLAGNALGLNALFELTSRASLEGQYPVGKPRIDADLTAETLAKYPGAMLIGTTGCPSGAVQTRIRLGQYDQAVAEAAKWQGLAQTLVATKGNLADALAKAVAAKSGAASD